MDEALVRSLLPGFGIVGASDRLVASHDDLGIEAAVEVSALPEGSLEDGPQRLVAVASQVSELAHRNLAGLLLAGYTEDGRWFLMTERPGEPTLARELRDLGPEPMALQRALSILAQLASALAAAHGKGIFHRDLRPELIGFGPTKPDDVVVQLHGLGRLTLLEAAGLVPRGDADIVSLAYASPEQLVGGSEGAATDVYAFGALAFRLCTGRLPFECASADLYKAAHCESIPPRPQDRRPGYLEPLPQAVDAMVLSCLEKDPAKRPAAGEMSRSLSEAAREEARRARDRQRARGPLGAWKRIRDQAIETARYVQYVQLGSEPLAEALAAFGPHDEALQERDQVVEEVAARWDEVHDEKRGREHRLRHAALVLGLDRGRLVALGAGDQPGAQDLASQIGEVLQSLAVARGEAEVALQLATSEVTRAREAAEDWARQEPNRVLDLVEAVRERRDASGDPSLQERINALSDLVAQTEGGTVPTLPGQ